MGNSKKIIYSKDNEAFVSLYPNPACLFQLFFTKSKSYTTSILFSNKAILNLTTIKNTKGKTLESIFPQFKTSLSKIYPINKKSKKSSEEFFYSKTKQWFNCQIIQIKDDLFYFLLDDITKIKETQKLNLIKEEKFKKLFDKSLEALCIFNQTGEIIDVNKQFCKLIGFSQQHIKKLSIYKLHSILNIKKTKKILTETLKKEFISNETTFVIKKNKPIVINYSIQLINKDEKLFQIIIRDITLNKKNETILIENETKYRRLFETSNDAIFIHDKSGNILDVNSNAIWLLGYSYSQFLKMNLLELHDKKDVLIIKKVFSLFRKKGVSRFVTKLKRSDGVYIDVDINSNIIDKQTGIGQGIVRDISEFKRIEQKLILGERNYRELVDKIHAILWRWDSVNKCFTFVSNEAESILGYPIELWTNEKDFWINHMHPDDRDWVTAYSDLHSNQLENHEIEYRMFKANGDVVWFRDIVQVIPEGNKPKELLGAMIDITKTKKAEEHIKENELRFKEAQQIGKVGSWVNDVILNKTEWSDECYRIFGYEIGELEPLEIFTKHIHPDDKNIYWNALKKALNDKRNQIISYEFRIIDRYGIERFCVYNSRMNYNKDGKIIKAYGTIQDISDIKKAEQIIERKLKFEQFISLISTLLGNLSPDNKDKEISQVLFLILEQFKVDKIEIAENNEIDNKVYYTSVYNKNDNYNNLTNNCVSDLLPWFALKIKNGELFYFNSPDEIKDIEDSINEKYFIRNNHLISGILVPIIFKNYVFGSLILSTINSQIFWSKEIIDHLRLVSELIAMFLHRQKTEKKLIENEQKYRLLFNEMTVGFALHEIVYNENGIPIDYRFLDINPAYEKITGLGYNVINKRVLEILPKLEKYWIETYIKVAETGNPIYYENYVAELGKYFEVFAFSPEKGKFAVFVSDITKRKFIENNIKESETKFRKVFNENNDAMVLQKFDNDQIGEIIEINDVALKMLGYTKEELIIFSIKEITIVDSSLKNEFSFENLIKDKYDIDEKYIKTKSGSVIPVEIRYHLFEYNDKSVLLTIIRDISERKLNEQKVLGAIIETEEKERRHFAEELHDGLGPLLSSIKMYVKFLFSQKDDSQKEKIFSNLNKVIDESVNSVRRISNLLSPQVLNDFGFNVAIQSFCDKIQTSTNLQIDLNNKEFNVFLSKEQEIIFYRIITELINNTIKHANASRIGIILKSSDNFLNLEYSDDGIGFDAESMLKDGKGGLGIINIRNRIKTFNGNFAIFSKSGEGIKVSVQLDKVKI